MTVLGIFLFCSAVSGVLYRYRAAKPAYLFPRYGYLGAAVLLGGEALLFAKLEPVATYFTAIAWTGYILWADAAVFSLRGKSLLQTYPAEFACIAFCSIPLWLIFESYNLRLENWTYVGLPQNWFARTFGYGWAFATIWPGIFETAALLRGTGLRPSREPASRAGRDREGGVPNRRRVCWGAEGAVVPTKQGTSSLRMKSGMESGMAAPLSVLGGVVMLIVPVFLPRVVRPYLFGAVWLGFIFLLEPINCRAGRESLWRDLERGQPSRLLSLLGAGIVCGIFWEFWNFWAQARWVYTFPIFERWKIFAMPIPGYFGFPPFAVECFALFAFLVPCINRVFEKLGAETRFRWEALDL